MLKNERKINYMVGLARKLKDLHTNWIGIKINFWPLVYPCLVGHQAATNSSLSTFCSSTFLNNCPIKGKGGKI